MRATIMLANIAAISTLLGMFLIEKDMSLVLMAFSLLGLGLLGEVAANEQESFDKAYMCHYYDYVIQKNKDGNYCHAVYENYKAGGLNNLKAYARMQKDIDGFEAGTLYKEVNVKPTLVTRVLMTKVGGAK